jgi:benzoyl-CoA-dihydrodiol lyase
MADDSQARTTPVTFETHPDRYRHWRLGIEGEIARLTLDVDEKAPLAGGPDLVQNSYDLGVDIELADAILRLRFEHPEVRVVLVSSGKERIFCAGANIRMLAASGHPFKVNFCKFTNETRLALEDASARSGLKSLAALNGTAAGGGYELALACDRIALVDDRSSAVSLPEVPLLGVLPGTGGLTRVVDKRKVRRDRADHLATIAEGIKGKRALEWGLVDVVLPLSRFGEGVLEEARKLAAGVSPRSGPGVVLGPLGPAIEGTRWTYRHLQVDLDPVGRLATLTVSAPETTGPIELGEIRRLGADWWPLRVFRELDDAILRLRFNEPELGTWVVRTRGAIGTVLAIDAILANPDQDWFVAEVGHFIGRTLKRLEASARSVFALVEGGSCFAGTLFELGLAADRTYMLADPEGEVRVALSALNGGRYPMANGLSRLQTRFLGEPEAVGRALEQGGRSLGAVEAEKLGLVTEAPDDLDWEDTVRVALEERASLSPDALTGMESNFRNAGPETLETKILGRLSAWQNWIFQRPNAVGPQGALTLYGHPQRPSFDWRRT